MLPLHPLSCLQPPPITHSPLCSVQAGKFFADEFVGPIMSCSTEAAGEAAVEADVAAAMARALRTEAGATRLRSGQRGAVQSQSRPAGSDGVGAGGSSSGSGRQAHCDAAPGATQGAASDSSAGGLPFGWKLPPSFQWPWQHSQQQRHAVPTSSRATATEARAPGTGSSSSSGASAAFTAQQAAGVTTKVVADRGRGGGVPGSRMTQQKKEARGGGQGGIVGGEEDAEVRPHTRPLNDREMGMVGGLVQRLMAAEVAGGEGGGLARRN